MNRISFPLFASIALLSVSTVVSGCMVRTSNVYSRQEMGAPLRAENGTVLSVRQVRIEGTGSGVGAAAGAVAGGIGGYQIGGNGAVNAVGAVGGAVLGGLIGMAAESALTSDTAQEVLVRLDSGKMMAYIQKNDDPNALLPGDRVLVLSGEKARVVRDTSGVPAPRGRP